MGLRRSVLSLIVLICLSACSGLTNDAPINPSSIQTYDFSPFNRVVVKVPVNLRIHLGSALSRVVLRGNPRDLDHIKMRSKRNTFMMVLDENQSFVKREYPRSGPIQVDIYTKRLTALTYQGKGLVVVHGIHASPFDLKIQNPGKTLLDGHIDLRCLTVVGPGYVEIKGVNSRNLRIKLKGRPKVQLTGVANITRLELRKGALFSFYWVKSRTLILRAYDDSRIQLAGAVDRLDVELWGKSRFNGCYLRSLHTYVKTHDHSLAEIVSVRDQHTLANDASDIYFYNLPTFKTDFMGLNGAVLDMRDWHLEVAQPYTIYNK